MAAVHPSPADWANLLDQMGNHIGQGRIICGGRFSFALHSTEKTLKYRDIINISKTVWTAASLEDKKKIFKGLSQIIAKKEKELEAGSFINKYLKAKKLAQMKLQFQQATQNFIETPTRTGFYEGERFIGRIWQEGIIYEGTFVEGRPEGRCKVTDKEGNIFAGTFDSLGRLSGRVGVTWADGRQVEEVFVPELLQRKWKAKMRKCLLDLPEIERSIAYKINCNFRNELIQQAVKASLKGENNPELSEMQKNYDGLKLIHQAITRTDHAKRLLAQAIESEIPIVGLQTKKELEGLMCICRHRQNYANYAISLDLRPLPVMVETIQTNIDLLDDVSSDRVVQLEDGSTFFAIPGGSKGHLVSYGFQKKEEEYFFILFNRGAGIDKKLHGSFQLRYQGKVYGKTTVAIKTTREALRNGDFLRALIQAKEEDSKFNVDSIYHYFIEERRGHLVKSREEQLLEQLKETASTIGPELASFVIQFMDLDPNFHSYQLFGTCTESNGTTMEKWMAPSSTRTTLKLFTSSILSDDIAREIFSDAIQERNKTIVLHQLARVKQGLATKLTSAYRFTSPKLWNNFPQSVRAILVEMQARLDSQALPNLANTWDYRPGEEMPSFESRLDKELKKLNLALATSSDPAEVLARRGNIYLLQGNLDDALKDFNLSFFFKPNNAYVVARIGEIYRLKGDLDQALEHFNQALNLNDGDPYAIEKRALVYLAKNNLPETIKDAGKLMWAPNPNNHLEDLNAAIHINSGDKDLLNTRGNYYGKEGQMELALRDYTASIAIQPDPQNLMNRATINIGQGKYDEALADLEEILKLNPDDLKDYPLDWLRERIQHLKDLKNLNIAIASNPWNAAALVKRGECILHTYIHPFTKELGNELALKDFDTALIMEPRNNNALEGKQFILLQWAEKNLKSGFIDQALNHLEAALTLNPTNRKALEAKIKALFKKADVYLMRRSLLLAIQALTEILTVNPNNFLALMKRAHIYQMQGEIDLALADLEKILRLNPDNLPLDGIKEYIQYLKELKNLNAAIASDPRNIKALVKRAEWHVNNGNPKLALKDLDAAIAFRSDSLDSDQLAAKKEALLKRGELHLKFGRPHLASKDFDVVLQLDPHNSTALAKKKECTTSY